MKLIKQVLEYNNTFQIATPEQPQLPSTQIWEARQQTLKEEIEEQHSAYVERDINKVALTVTNTIYSMVSLACELGLQDHLENCLYELHRAKMSNIDENGEPVLLNDETIRSNAYTPPNLEHILGNKK